MIGWLVNRYLSGPSTPRFVLTALTMQFCWLFFLFVTGADLWGQCDSLGC